MSTETQKVNALRVMIMAADAFPSYSEKMARVLEATGAVAELIEAAKIASAILGHAYHTQIKGELAQEAHDTYQRLDAALARIGGDV